MKRTIAVLSAVLVAGVTGCAARGCGREDAAASADASTSPPPGPTDGEVRSAAAGQGSAARPSTWTRLVPCHDGANPADVALLETQVAARMPRHGRAFHRRLASVIHDESRRAGLDPLLVLALIHVESSFDPAAVSDAGAVGLMQLHEPTMRQEVERSGLRAANPLDPVANVRAGIRYLRRLVAAFGSTDLALMAYNAGPNRIGAYRRAGGIPERFYVYPRRIRGELQRLRAQSQLRRTAAPPALAAAGQALRGPRTRITPSFTLSSVGFARRDRPPTATVRASAAARAPEAPAPPRGAPGATPRASAGT